MIVEAINWFNERHAADVLIVGRGGGSIEDLWAFNDESVARAIAASAIPVISAVGHETDFTIADFVADLRAPTPSAAAELAVPDSLTLRQRLSNVNVRMADLLLRKTSAGRARLEMLSAHWALRQPEKLLDEKRLVLDGLSQRVLQAQQTRLERGRQRLSLTAGKLSALSPLGVLERGYSIVLHGGSPVRRADTLAVGDELTLRFAKGEVQARVTKTGERC